LSWLAAVVGPNTWGLLKQQQLTLCEVLHSCKNWLLMSTKICSKMDLPLVKMLTAKQKVSKTEKVLTARTSDRQAQVAGQPVVPAPIAEAQADKAPLLAALVVAAAVEHLLDLDLRERATQAKDQAKDQEAVRIRALEQALDKLNQEEVRKALPLGRLPYRLKLRHGLLMLHNQQQWQVFLQLA